MSITSDNNLHHINQRYHRHEAPAPPFDHVAESVKTEVAELQLKGVNVALTETADQFRPNPERQQMIDDEIDRLSAAPIPEGANQFRSLPALSCWAPLTKRAVALRTLYHPMGFTVGEGIAPNAYDVPLFDGKSAATVLTESRPDKAASWLAAYEAFVPAVIDNGTATKLGSRDFFMGVKDAEAARTRATAAMEIAADHIEQSPHLKHRQDLISASLACGAASPVYELVRSLEDRGHNFKEVLLVDQDPMALATAHSLAVNEGISDKIVIGLHDLLAENITGFINPKSVDVVDLLGLFEYIPNDDEKGRWASHLLRSVKEIIKPGGLIILGNMLNDRPQQDFFSKVVQWPSLQQRTIQQVLDIICEAGFTENDVTVRVPSEGVYAVYGIKVAERRINVTDLLFSYERRSNARSASVAEQLGKDALKAY